jgi:YD repeat-containing protein
MSHLTWKSIFCLILHLAFAGYAYAQTTTYHLHKELSSTTNLFQLQTSNPDGTTAAATSANLKNLATGEYIVKAFDTQANVPNVSGVIPAGSTVTFTLWMKKSATSGVMYPRAKLYLNSSSGTLIGTSTSATQLTTTLAKYTFTATTGSNITMTTTDRFYLWTGVSVTTIATVNTNAVLNVEGTLNGNYDSTVAIPSPIPAPTISNLSPTSGVIGTPVTVTGTNFGATQGTSTIAFNGITATATSWSNTSIVATVPVGATTGAVAVTKSGLASNGVAFTVKPKIDSITPGSGPVGTSVTVAGSSFGATQGTSTITFNGVSTTPTSWNNTGIVALVPASAVTGPVIVTVNGQASNSFSFIVAPKINSLSPTSGSVGDSATISGTTFGASQGTSTVTFNGTTASPTSWSATSVVAPIPSGATTGLVLVTVGGVSSNGVNFTVNAPGTVSGKVTRDDGTTPITGATVKAMQGSTIVATTVTNSTGDYTLALLAQGSYVIEASASGYGTKNQKSVTVNGGAIITVNLSLDAIIAGPISYLYDAAGRLVSAIGPTETIKYNYDAVGNLLSISRQSSSQLSIINVLPNSGPVGTIVTINGTGFSGVASENTVQFNGVAAVITSATINRIITTVPSGVSPGTIQIALTTPGGTVMTPFTVEAASSQPKIQVTPGNISVAPANQVQFTATITGLADQSIKWSVNGVDGGNASVGTISSTGLYTSLNLPSASIHNIRATSIANPLVFGQAQVATLDPAYAQAVISPSVSILRPVVIASATAPSVSIRINLSTVLSGVTAAGVSVRNNSTTVTSTPTAPLLSVRRAPQTIAFGSISPNLSLTTGPHVQAVSPANGSKGTTFTLTITGVNLQGATGLKFITSAGALDSNVTATGASVSPDGTSLTASVTIGATAALGTRIVVVTTSANNSLAVDVGSNIIEVVP